VRARRLLRMDLSFIRFRREGTPAPIDGSLVHPVPAWGHAGSYRWISRSPGSGVGARRLLSMDLSFIRFRRGARQLLRMDLSFIRFRREGTPAPIDGSLVHPVPA